MPATNAASEWSLSTMRRIKSYLRSSMGQARLNHLMVLSIYKEMLDRIDLRATANNFVEGSEHVWPLLTVQQYYIHDFMHYICVFLLLM